MANKKKILGIALTALLTAVAAGVVVFTLLPEKDAPAQAQQGKKKHRKNLGNLRLRKNRGTSVRKIETARSQGKAKPNLLDDLDEEAKLTAAEKALLQELQDGVDAESMKQVVKAVEKIQKIIREKGQDAVPVLLRTEAVEALGWFLPASLAELLGFMNDTNSEVIEEVMSQFESAIDDAGIGDRELSNIFKTVAKVISDDDALDAIFMGIESDMRNSIAVETYLEILKTGSDAAKARVWESVEDFTGEDDIKTVEDLEKWSKDPENADDEDDEDFYGPDNDNDSDE